jgi:hypothetical protein
MAGGYLRMMGVLSGESGTAVKRHLLFLKKFLMIVYYLGTFVCRCASASTKCRGNESLDR